MYMPYFNTGFGFGGGLCGGFCFGSCPPFIYNPFMANPLYASPFPMIMANTCMMSRYSIFSSPCVYSYCMPSVDSSQFSVPSYNIADVNSLRDMVIKSIKVPQFYASSSSGEDDSSKKAESSKKTADETKTGKKEIKESKENKEISYDAKKLENKWKNSKFASRAKRLPSEFFQKVVDISKKINCNPDDLMALMNAESGLNASAKNPLSSATGLIQFMDSTAKGLGTSCSALAKMTETEQLKYVEKYLVNASSKFNNKYLDAGTLYALVFMPSKAKNHTLCAGSTNKEDANYNIEYANNSGLDIVNETSGKKKGEENFVSDGKITKSDLSARVMQFMA